MDIRIKNAPIACASCAAWGCWGTYWYLRGDSLYAFGAACVVALTVEWARRAVAELDK